MKRRWLGLIAVFLLAGCQMVFPAGITQRENPASSPADEITPTVADPCPLATPEAPPYVSGLVSPTDELSQIVVVQMGRIEEAVITTESGTFRAAGENGVAKVEVKLLPNTLHHLLVEAKVMQVEVNGCSYGGYTLQSDADQSGQPLVIQQGKSEGKAESSGVITAGNAENLQLLQTLGMEQRANGFTFVGSTRIAVYGEQLPVQIFELSGSAEPGVLGESISGQAADYDEAGQLLAVGDRDLQLHLFHLGDGSYNSLVGPKTPISRTTGLALSPDGQLAAVGTADNRVLVWRIRDQKLLAEYEGDTTGFLETFDSLHWLDDETLMALGVRHGYIWQVSKGGEPRTFNTQAREAEMINAAFSADGNRAVFGTLSGGVVYVYQLDNQQGFSLPLLNNAQLYRAAFSPDNSLLAASTTDGEIFLWNLATREKVASASLDLVSSLKASQVAFSPDGKMLAVLAWQDYLVNIYGLP